jgi:hypothetical protein
MHQVVVAKYRRSLISLSAAALILGALPFTSQGAASATQAAAPACPTTTRSAQAVICGKSTSGLQGFLFSNLQSTFSYGSGSYPTADAFNFMRAYTNAAKDTNVEVGTHFVYTGSTTQYQPYWSAAGPQYVYKALATATTSADGRSHTFTIVRTCATCSTWDIGYDSEKRATVTGQPIGLSKFFVTGWAIWSEYRRSSFAKVVDSFQVMGSNGAWIRPAAGNIGTLVDQGDCSRGANPEYCWKFTTALKTVTEAGSVRAKSWEVSKPLVAPAVVQSAVPPTSAPQKLMTRGQATALVQRLQGSEAASSAGATLSVKEARTAAPEGTTKTRLSWQVSSETGRMRTLTGSHEWKRGFLVTIDRVTGLVTQACLGAGCTGKP